MRLKIEFIGGASNIFDLPYIDYTNRRKEDKLPELAKDTSDLDYFVMDMANCHGPFIKINDDWINRDNIICITEVKE